MLIAQNKSLAEWNLSQEPRLTEAKKRLSDTYELATQERESALGKKAKLGQ